VTFDDTGIGSLTVNLSNNYLSAASVTVNSAFDYVVSGNGSIAGLENSTNRQRPFEINNANSTRGT